MADIQNASLKNKKIAYTLRKVQSIGMFLVSMLYHFVNISKL